MTAKTARCPLPPPPPRRATSGHHRASHHRRRRRGTHRGRRSRTGRRRSSRQRRRARPPCRPAPWRCRRARQDGHGAADRTSSGRRSDRWWPTSFCAVRPHRGALSRTHMLYCLFRHAASQVLRDVVVHGASESSSQQLSGGALAPPSPRWGFDGQARCGPGREPLGADRRAAAVGVIRVLGHAAGRAHRAQRLLADPALDAARRRVRNHVRALRAPHASGGAGAGVRAADPTGRKPRYNIAPMQDVPVIRTSSHGGRELTQVRWAAPRWAKDPIDRPGG